MALNFANNNSLSSITSLPASISGGGLNLISTQTASGSSYYLLQVGLIVHIGLICLSLSVCTQLLIMFLLNLI